MHHVAPSKRTRHPALRTSTQAVLLSLLTLPALAQQQPQDPAATKLEKVEVTGSAIKRLDAETALPLQVISREDIAKAGVTTAAELMAKVSANVNGLTDGGSINVGGYDQKGFNSANLRGIGTSSTLVLLNGRRMANFASPGDDAGVDLNNIPAAAIQRVEILLDGASALYGSDAIGGVINFITRRDYEGAEINVFGGGTPEGGAGKRAVSLAAGTGRVERDGFNVFGVLDAQHTGSLRSSQRSFINDLQIPQRLPQLLSGFPNPANIDLSDDQLAYLQSKGFTINGQPLTSNRINLSRPGCNPPANLNLPGGIGGPDGCTYNYMGDTELYPTSDKLSFLGRGVLDIGAGRQLYGEVTLSQAKTWYVGSATRLRLSDFPVSAIPALAATGLADIEPTVGIRARISEAGGRTSNVTSTGQRYLLGLSGSWDGWDYDMALNHSTSRVDDADTHGYLLYNELVQGVRSGQINIFGPSSPAGLAYLNSIQVNDVVRKAYGTMDAIDAKASKVLGQMDGGDFAMAVGAEFRREAQTYHPSALLASDNINEDGASGSTGDTSYGRNVAAAYLELDLPFAKQWDMQLALRGDHVQGVGNSANPKIALRYQPSKQLLWRGSISTGFRAPSLTDLYRPTLESATATLPDPVCMAANNNNLAECADNWTTYRYSNPNLKPETSLQYGLGFVIEPDKHLTMSLDYWNITKKNLISEIGDDIILGNLAKYGNLVHRYSDPAGPPNSDFMQFCGSGLDPSDNSICYIELRKENRGQQKSSGLDLMLDLHDLRTSVGTFGARLTGTLMLTSQEQTSPGDPFVSNLDKFVTDGVVQRWRHRLTLDWDHGDYGLTLANTYYAGYEDQNSAIDNVGGTIVQANRVKAYSLWDLSGFYQFSKNLRLRAGVQNLANTPPPYSNQAYFFISGYDPSYTDPRGRFVYGSLQYQFK